MHARLGWRQPAEVYSAILFHDAVYVLGAKDNEAKSAAWACRAIAEYALPASADRVAELIELTAAHGTLADATGDTALFLDADMAIVGSEIGEYREYSEQIRREYAAVPADAYPAEDKRIRHSMRDSARGGRWIQLGDAGSRCRMKENKVSAATSDTAVARFEQTEATPRHRR